MERSRNSGCRRLLNQPMNWVVRRRGMPLVRTKLTFSWAERRARMDLAVTMRASCFSVNCWNEVNHEHDPGVGAVRRRRADGIGPEAEDAARAVEGQASVAARALEDGA